MRSTGVLASGAALVSGTHAVIGDRDVLRGAVCAYLAAEQARGSTVESVIQAVRQILAKAPEATGHMSEKLARQLVNSCLEPYRSRGIA